MAEQGRLKKQHQPMAEQGRLKKQHQPMAEQGSLGDPAPPPWEGAEPCMTCYATPPAAG